jgi:putative endonuclease
MGSTYEAGSHFESLAGAYLAEKGYRVVERNFRFGHKEIDIIALDGETIVFVEVKGRAGPGMGLAGECVDSRKIRHIVTAARAYLWKRRLTNKPCRFDVLCVNLVGNRDAEFVHIRNAFEA